MPHVDNRVSLGSVIVIATMLISLGVGWATMGVTGQQTAEELRKVVAVAAQHEARIRALETREAAQIARIETELGQINRTLDALVKKLERGQ